MIQKHNDRCKGIINLYFWCTVAGVAALIALFPLGLGLLTIGANSLYLALGYGGFDEFMPLVRFSGFWIIGYTILLIVAYVLACKKAKYIPFLVLVCLDTLFVCFSAVLELTRSNLYGFALILPDMIISIAICIMLILAVCAYHKEKLTEEETDIRT